MAGFGGRGGAFRRSAGGRLSKAVGKGREARKQWKRARGIAKIYGIAGVKAYGR